MYGTVFAANAVKMELLVDPSQKKSGQMWPSNINKKNLFFGKSLSNSSFTESLTTVFVPMSNLPI